MYDYDKTMFLNTQGFHVTICVLLDIKKQCVSMVNRLGKTFDLS